MSTAEQLANSILLDNAGVHILLWDDQDDLIRALILVIAVIGKEKILPLLLSSETESLSVLRKLFEIKNAEEISLSEDEEVLQPKRNKLLLLFLQQATSKTIGPLLNGWRRDLAFEPGSLIVVRKADFMNFQKYAPDLASFYGPKIYDSSSLLYIWGEKTAKNVKPYLPNLMFDFIKKLPGEAPSENELKEWIQLHTPIHEEF
jgi:hypothetical protein